MHRRFLPGILILSALLIASCSTSPGGNSFSSPLLVELSLEELTACSDWIVTGKITAGKSSWDTGRTNIYTHYTLSVEEWIKGGSEQETLIIKVPGGKVGLTSQRVEDAANFKKGEKVLVFLSCNDDGTGTVVGGFQGKYTAGDGEVVGSDSSLQELISQIKKLLH